MIKKISVLEKKIFVFGNSLLEQDSLALRVAKRLKGKLKGIEFRAVQSLPELGEGKELCIMDVAVGIEKVQLIEDLDRLATVQPVSGHDFDLALELKILAKIGKLGKVKIIAVPAERDLEKAVAEVKRLFC